MNRKSPGQVRKQWGKTPFQLKGLLVCDKDALGKRKDTVQDKGPWAVSPSRAFVVAEVPFTRFLGVLRDPWG